MRKWLPLTAVCLGTFMLLVDVTIVTVALPEIAQGLDASFANLQWVLNGYALALAALLLAAGSVADIAGRRRVYVGGLVLFAAASLACGVAPNAGVLVAARCAQGIGGAAMFATTMALLAATYQGSDRGVAFGVWGAVNGAAAAVGPLLGGVLTEHLSWRAIFLVNLPVCVATVVLTLLVIDEGERAHGPRLDLAGMVTFTLCAGGLVYALIVAGEDGWTSTRALALFALAAAALVAFVWVERVQRNPLLDLGLFRRPSFVSVMLAGLTLTAGAFATLAYTSLWLQTVVGLSPIGAGLALAPMALTAFVVAGATGRFVDALPPRLPIGVGLLLVAIGSAMQSFLDAGSSWTAVTAGLVVVGIGVGVGLPRLSSAAMSTVPIERGGVASGALNTFRQVGFALGIAVLGLVFSAGVEHRLDGEVPDPQGVAAAVTGGAAPDLAPVRGAVAEALGDAYLVAAGVSLVGGVLVLALLRPPAQQTPSWRSQAGSQSAQSAQSANAAGPAPSSH